LALLSPSRILLTSCTCSASSELPFSVQLDSLTEGARVHLPVPGSLDGILSTSWFRGHKAQPAAMIFSAEGLPGPAYTGREMLGTHGSLVIRNVTAQDSGSYTVVLETSSGRRSATEQIHVKRLQPSLLFGRSGLGIRTRHLRYACSCSSLLGKGTVIWARRAGALEEVLRWSGTLCPAPYVIFKMGYFREVAGAFQTRNAQPLCVASAHLASLSVIADSFKTVPLLTFPETIQGIIQSDLNYSVILEWVTTMNPEPVQTWTLNGKICGTGEKLFIRRLSWEQLGTYVCTATNSKEQLSSQPVTVSL
uniref:Ig-like domain-containing protein n=1 Tax=Otolemur garnettii TaxID=30611 RepID=H0XIE9_OTOGA